ncbi:MAG TPA: Omp28-related outer membrane protein [Candidatus Cloacimonadota bacterium]|nr:Omp28-related outer membrane protein [Candidatus Cloacimonadota bacterium]
MRKLASLVLLLGLVFALNAVPRNLVVVEVATGTWCGYCPGAAMGCHDLLTNGHAVAIIKNHGGDSYENTYSSARNSYYGVSGYPTAFFDGQNPTSGGSSSNSMYNNYLPKVNARLNVPAKYTLSALGNANGNSYSVSVTVRKDEADTNTNVKLHAVLTESNIPHNWFNQTTVDNVNRLMVPNQNGTAIDLGTGEQTTVNLTFNFSNAWNVANCEMVFFLQNQTSKEILQGVKYSLPELVGAYPISVETLDFPNMYVGGSYTIPVTIVNFSGNPASGTIAISNPVFTISNNSFNIPAAGSVTLDAVFTPTAAQTYTGTMTITSNLYNHPTITIPLSGTGFLDNAPVAEDVCIQGPPVEYQTLTGSYSYSDPDGDEEGETIFAWYRIVNDEHVPIEYGDEITYQLQAEDTGYQIVFEVTPYDIHGMPGETVRSQPIGPIVNVPAPRNLSAVVEGENTVVLTWEPPQYFDRGFVGYRLYRGGLLISTITNPNTLTFSDTYVPIGVHEYWVCSLFNNPMLISGPSNVVSVSVGVANDDVVSSPVSVSVHPTPFKDYTQFSINAKANSELELEIYNLKGQLIKTDKVKVPASGVSTIVWDGKDSKGNQAQSGVYFYRLNGRDLSANGKIVKIK